MVEALKQSTIADWAWIEIERLNREVERLNEVNSALCVANFQLRERLELSNNDYAEKTP